jgi:transcriptional regulator with XRE-family HTH domain
MSPEDVGLPPGTGVRRTPGLRREELATLAGVSIDYYTRLERGKETRPSQAVLDSLARVLRLQWAEEQHLRALAQRAALSSRAAARRERRPSSRTVRPSALLLLEAVRPNPAYVVSRTNDLLAANPGGSVLMPGLMDLPPAQRNVTRYLFLDPLAHRLWTQWEEMADGAVAHLRAVAGGDPDDPALTALVGELSMKSPRFAALWGRYEVRPRSAGIKHFDHPAVGKMTLRYETMPLVDSEGQRIVVYLAEPGTPDHDAMVLLDMSASARSEDPRPAPVHDTPGN